MGQNGQPSQRVEVSERQRRVLRELDVNVDALNVVNLLSRHTVAPKQAKRKRGKYLDERHVDGDLLDYDMFVAAEEAKTAAKAQEEKEKAERAAERQRIKEARENEKAKRALERQARAEEKSCSRKGGGATPRSEEGRECREEGDLES
ncbi:hypothetical protein ON010_g18917 [Phytophthora cinnamomi]|nr:hypothetical protein ON010_g18917 [Phytophthora cinnamomi]